MNKESKLNLNAGDYAIGHCDSNKTYNGLEVHKMLCDAYIAGNNDTLEDDDERIKNSLINLIKMSNEVGGLALHKWEADEMLAWIKKQGEHANFRNKIQVGDKVTRNEDGVLVNLSQLNRVAKPEENKGNIGGFSSNSEWSKENEIRLNTIIHDITIDKSMCKYEVAKSICDEQINWLKSLRPQNTYNPYKAVVESIAEMCKHYDGVSHIGLRDFYDNVKVKCKDAKEYDKMFPQAQWKPSDEQLNNILDVLSFDNCTPKRRKLLQSLYEQLKKLKKGKV